MQNKAKNKNKGRQGVCSERVIFVKEPERRGGWGLSKLIGQEQDQTRKAERTTNKKERADKVCERKRRGQEKK